MDSDQAKKTEKKIERTHSEIVELHPTKPDITEHKKAEEAVRRSKQQWEKTFNAMSDWVVLIDVGGRIIRTNRIGEDFTSKPLAEIVGQLCCKLVHGSEEHIPGCPLMKMLQTGQRASTELYFPGTDRWLMVTVDPVTDNEGNIVGAVHITRDISERKKAEKKLRESEARYRNLFEQSPLGIGLATPDGRVAHVNKTMEVITGYFKEELKKINLADTYENPQDRKKLLETIERYGCAVDFPTRLKRKDGTVYDALLNVSRVRFGDQDFFQTICMDVTEQKEAERELQRSEKQASAAVEAARGFTFNYDIATGKVNWGGAIEAITGYTPEEFAQVDIDGWAKMIHPNDRDRVLSILQTAIHELDRATAEYRFRTKNGGYITLSSISLTEKKDGKAVRLVGILQDITERKRTEEALRDSEEKYRDIFENAREAIVTMDLEGKITNANKLVEEYGFKRKNWIGKSHFEFIAEQYRDKAIRDFDKLVRGNIVEGEIELITPRGNIIVEYRDNPIRRCGEIIGVQAILTDITERKRAEEALRRERDKLISIFEAMADGVYIVNQQHNIQYVNPVLEKDFGAWQGCKCYQYFHDRKEVCPWCKNEQVFAGKTVRWEWYSFKNQRTYDLIDTPLMNADGSISKLEMFRDITERKQTEEQIEKLARFPAENPNPVLRISKDCTILYANRASSVVLETWGKKVGERLPQDCCNRVEEALSSGKVSTFEFACHDGRIFGVTLAPIVESCYVNVYGLDITEHKQAMEQIEKLARFPAEDPYPVIRISARGTVVYANDASLPLMKVWRCGVNGSVSGRWYEFVLDALSSGQSQQTEVKCDGQTFSLVFAPVMDANYVNVYGLDITECKKAEEAVRASHDYLERLTNSMWDTVFSVKMPERVIEWVNDSYKLIGYEPEECIGRTTEFLYPDKSEFIDFGNKLQKAINAGDDVLHVEELLRRKNGEIFPAEITTTFFRTKGKITNVTSIISDITERKRVEEKLLAYQKQLKSLASQMTLTEEQERRRIATDLHDNITQSLAMSKLKLDLMRDSKSSSSADLVEVLNETSRNIEQIIQEVRTLTFDLSSPILYELGFEAAVAEWLTERIGKEHGIATEFEDDEQPKPLDDDTRTVLFRDVRELLTNVVKHAQAKKVKVSIRKVGSRIHVSVEDDGRGFDPEKVAAAAAKNGVFGLFSIRERLKQLGGNIEIESGSGHGTRVTLLAPLKSKSLEEKRG